MKALGFSFISSRTPGVVFQELLQFRMLLYEFAIVYQRRILANLFGDLGMTVH